MKSLRMVTCLVFYLFIFFGKKKKGENRGFAVLFFFGCGLYGPVSNRIYDGVHFLEGKKGAVH